ncbi:MAG: hypothetical protein GXZ15_02110, partial [Campylobacter sp.]|nr:hypothetical protein [Campylobacter sp.]
DYKLIYDLACEIYPKNPLRAELLVKTVKEYIAKTKTYKGYNLDKLLKDIDSDLKHQNRYIKKINFEHLRRLMSLESDGYALIQQRVYEFLIQEVKFYSSN